MKKTKKETINQLKHVLSRHLDVHLPKDQGATWWGGELSPEQLTYSLDDVRYLHRLATNQAEQLWAEGPGTVWLVETLLLPIIVKMELHGFAVDVLKLKERLKPALELTAQLSNEITTLLGEGAPCLGDSRGLRNWFKDKFSIEVKDVAEDTLAKADHPAAQALVAFRKAKKKVDLFEELIAAAKRDGRIHASLNPMGAQSGRLLASSPGIQIIPRGGEFRECFVASAADRRLVIADWQQIEFRIGVIAARDEVGLAMFRAGRDPHTETAAAILGKPLGEVTKEDRHLAKAVNFGFVYGQGVRGFLAYALANYGVSLSFEEARAFRDTFFKYYPGLKKWHREAYDFAESGESEVRTILGRRQLLTSADSWWDRFQAFVNTVVQGSAADLLKVALIELARALPTDSHLILPIHDEIIIDAPSSRAEEVKALMEKLMAKAFADLFDDIIPGPAEAHIYGSWGEK
jgi:DNA polymerase-1